jgi:putative hydrolase of the HAD superfamily
MSMRALIFEANDVLWDDRIYYDRARARFRMALVMEGYKAEEIDMALTRAELDLPVPSSSNPTGFSQSLTQAYRHICAANKRALNPSVLRELRDITQDVIKHPVVPREGTLETLSELSERGFHLVLLAQGEGDPIISKINQSGLRDWFNHLLLVPEIGQAVLVGLLQRYGMKPPEAHLITWIHGIVLRPALALNIGVIVIGENRDVPDDMVNAPIKYIPKIAALLDIEGL